MCGALSIPLSQKVFVDNYGGPGGKMNTSHNWTPNYYKTKNCVCCTNPPTWPENQLYRMQTTPKGSLRRDASWPDWNGPVDYGQWMR
jgi:hypothetical protein